MTRSVNLLFYVQDESVLMYSSLKIGETAALTLCKVYGYNKNVTEPLFHSLALFIHLLVL